jgi:predicted outer membrane repeat protein
MGRNETRNGRRSLHGRGGVRIESLEQRVLLAAATSVIYVDANVAADSGSLVHDGTTWAKAFDNLQSALDAAAATSGPDQIWIARGTYKPSKIYAPLDAGNVPVVGGNSGLNVANLKTFNLPSGVSLYGGLKFGDQSLASRDPAGNPTILSGDLAGNDSNAATPVTGQADRADNAWHIVTAGNDVTHTGVTVLLDGLQFIGGYAAGPNVGGTLSPFVQGHSDGGGVFSAFGSSVTINNCLFHYNYAASDGGGVMSDGSNLVVTHSQFLNNFAVTRAGGLEGLNDFEGGASHTSTIDNCYFQDNGCAVFGGAMVGEGAYQGANSEMTITNSTFVHNTAPEGGAIVFDTLTVTIDGCTFTNNVSTVNGGAISTTNVVGTIVGAPNHFATSISNSTFTGNSTLADQHSHDTFFPFPGINFARGGGALVAYMNGFYNIDHCSFTGNVALQSDGGAILNGNASANIPAGALYPGSPAITAYAVDTQVTHSVFLDNQAPNGSGGAIASETDGLSPASTNADTRLTLDHSILRDNASGGGGGGNGNGGAIYLCSSTALITKVILQGNDAVLAGNALFGSASVVNGLASSDPLALTTLTQANVLQADDVALA